MVTGLAVALLVLVALLCGVFEGGSAVDDTFNLEKEGD